MVEIETHIGLVVCIGEIVDPAGGVGEDIDYVSVYKVIQAGEFPVYGLADDVAVVIDIGCILGNHHFVPGYLLIGILEPVIGIKLVLSQGSLCVVEQLVTVVELLYIQHLLTGDGVTVVHALNGSLLVLVGLLPWNGLAPIQMRSYGFAVFVLGYHE